MQTSLYGISLVDLAGLSLLLSPIDTPKKRFQESWTKPKSKTSNSFLLSSRASQSEALYQFLSKSDRFNISKHRLCLYLVQVCHSENPVVDRCQTHQTQMRLHKTKSDENNIAVIKYVLYIFRRIFLQCFLKNFCKRGKQIDRL